MRKILALIGIVVSIGLFPATTLAASAGQFFPLVPCGASGQPRCTPCHLFETADNLIDFILFGVTGPVATFMIVIAGGMIMLDGANLSTVAKGRELLYRTLIGVTIILFAWVGTNTLIHALGRGTVGDKWYEFSCPEFLQGASQGGTVGGGGSSSESIFEEPLNDPKPSQGSPQQPNAALVAVEASMCSDRAKLAAAAGVPLVPRESAALKAAIICLMQDPVVKALTDQGQLYTFGRSDPLCNFTRGESVCVKCNHARHSCHYGGRTGTDGAEAVDFNWNGKWVLYDPANERRVIIADRDASRLTQAMIPGAIKVGGELALSQALLYSAAKNKCAVNRPSYEPIPGREHTHVSTTACYGK